MFVLSWVSLSITGDLSQNILLLLYLLQISLRSQPQTKFDGMKSATKHLVS